MEQVGPAPPLRALRPSRDFSVVLPEASPQILRGTYISAALSALDAVDERAHVFLVKYKKKINLTHKKLSMIVLTSEHSAGTF